MPLCSRDKLPSSYDAVTHLVRSFAIEVSEFLIKFEADQGALIELLEKAQDDLTGCTSVVDLDAKELVCLAHFAQLDQKADEAAELLSQVRPEALAPVLAQSIDSPISVERADEWIKFTMAMTQFEIEGIRSITFYGQQELIRQVDIKRQWIKGSIPDGTFPDIFNVVMEAIKEERDDAQWQSEQKLKEAGRIYGFPVDDLDDDSEDKDENGLEDAGCLEESEVLDQDQDHAT